LVNAVMVYRIDGAAATARRDATTLNGTLAAMASIALRDSPIDVICRLSSP